MRARKIARRGPRLAGDVYERQDKPAGMRRMEFVGVDALYGWDFWECRKCGLSSHLRVKCPCDIQRERAVRRESRHRNGLLRRAADESVIDRRALKEWIRIIRSDPCSYCGRRADTVDHIEPVYRGGSGDPRNLAPACRACNSKKKTMPLLWFLITHGSERN